MVGYGLTGRQRAEAVAELPEARVAATVDPAAPDPSALTRAPHHANLAEVRPAAYDAAVIAAPHDVAVALAATVPQHVDLRHP